MVASGVAATQRRCAYTSSHRNCRQFQEVASARQFAFAGLRFRAPSRGTEQPALARTRLVGEAEERGFKDFEPEVHAGGMT